MNEPDDTSHPRRPVSALSRKRNAPRTFRIGVLLSETTGYGRGVLRGIADFAEDHPEWRFRVEPPERQGIAVLQAWKPDGLVVMLNRKSLAPRLECFAGPIVTVCHMPLWPDAHLVQSDDDAVGRLGAEHLLETPAVSFGFVGMTEGSWATVRARAFANALAGAGHSCDVFSPLGKDPEPRDHLALRRWLVGRPRPCALMASNDVCGRLVLETCRDAGLLVPEEVAVLGVDNEDPLSRLVWPGLSSITLDTGQIGYRCAALLHRLLLGLPCEPGPVLVPPLGVASRRSTRQLPVRDAALSRALTFIQNSVSTPFSVAELLRHAEVSRTSLERSFRRHLDRTPLEEIRRARIAQARQLLLATDLPLKTVAARCGYAAPSRLIEAFLREVGCTPTQFRESRRRQGLARHG